MYRIAPSILSADFARLGDEVAAVVRAGADLIHLDVMDNHYVPTLTVGPLICAAIRPVTHVPVEVHLMVKPVDRMVPEFACAGADVITFHPDATENIGRTIDLIHDHGCKAGLALNPAAPLAWLDEAIGKLDVVLIMSVNPGFGGQKFINAALPKLREARRRIDASARPIWLEIDGGVNLDNIANAAQAGADTFVAGSAIYCSEDYATTIDSMRAQLAWAGSKRRAAQPA